MTKKLIILFTVLHLFVINAFSQAVEMADTMRSNGKIYVVVAVLCIIFIGIVVYLVSLDRKVSKLEKELEK